MGGESLVFEIGYEIALIELTRAAGLGVGFSEAGLSLAQAGLTDPVAGFGLAHLFADLGIIDPGERLARYDGIAVVDQDLGDAARKLGIDDDLIVGAEGATKAFD